MTRHLFAVLAVAALVSPAMAQVTTGTITGTLDGTPTSWTFSATQSDFVWDTNYARISLMGWPDAAPE